MSFKRENKCQYIGRIILDLTIYLAAFAVTMLMAFDKLQFIQPFARGFFCDDQDLMYPFLDDTISNEAIIVVAVFVNPFVMIIIETFSMCCTKRNCSKFQYITSIYKTVGRYLLGGTFTLLTVEICKSSVGRLRPHFFEACKPNWSHINCEQKFIRDYNCTNQDEEVLINARKSFPSGHAAAVCYEAIYLIIYLHVRIHRKTQWARVVCPAAQTLIVAGAIYISISRVQDYKHHATDVIGGAIIGVFGGIVTVIFHSDLVKEFLSDYQFKEDKPVDKMNSVNSEMTQKYDKSDLHYDVSRNGIDGDAEAKEQISYDNKGFVSDTGEKSRVGRINSNITSTIENKEQIKPGITPGFTDFDSQLSVEELEEKKTLAIESNSDKTRKRHIDVGNTEKQQQEQQQKQNKGQDHNFVTTISVISDVRL